MYDPKLLEGVRTIHFIGCGGSGTYPLIQILHSRGYAITGSDVEETKTPRPSVPSACASPSGMTPLTSATRTLVVYSAAIHDDNPELQAARARGIKAVERSVMLGYISRTHAQSIGVAGTHGKTTTTGMITTMLELAGKDPAAVIGGKLPLIGGYGKAGNGQSVVIEACEYHETFLHLTCAVGVILNIDNDHLEYYGTMGKLKLAFQKFALLSRTVVFNMDDKNTMDVVNSIDRPVLSFGIEEEARFRAVNIGEYKPGFFEFDVLELGEHFAHIKLGVPGYHNIYNALAMLLRAVRWASSLRTPFAQPSSSTARAAALRSRASATARSSSMTTPTIPPSWPPRWRRPRRWAMTASLPCTSRSPTAVPRC